METSQFCIEIVQDGYFSSESQTYRCLLRQLWSNLTHCYPASIYLFKGNNRNTKKWFEICSVLTRKTSERHTVWEFVLIKLQACRHRDILFPIFSPEFLFNSLPFCFLFLFFFFWVTRVKSKKYSCRIFFFKYYSKGAFFQDASVSLPVSAYLEN